jgi:hypothetical protein
MVGGLQVADPLVHLLHDPVDCVGHLPSLFACRILVARREDVMLTMRRESRAFDPVVVGRRECDAWAAYYRHEWTAFLAGAVGMVRAGFGMNWPRTLAAAWYVLRANQAWAPYPGNDPERARQFMRRFYELVAADGALRPDPTEAARLEVEWWRVHRVHQREDGLSEDDLTSALCDLYTHVYGVGVDAVRDAAQHRVVAMRLSDEWVASGCDPASELLAPERRELVASYTALREAVSASQPRRSST